MNPNIEPIINTATALQAMAEAMEALTSAVEPRKRPTFDAALLRVRREKASLMAWVDAQR